MFKFKEGMPESLRPITMPKFKVGDVVKVGHLDTVAVVTNVEKGDFGFARKVRYQCRYFGSSKPINGYIYPNEIKSAK